MKRKVKHGSGLYQYLERVGVLEHGTDAEIKAAKRQYWNSRKAEAKRLKRKEQKSFTVFFTKAEMPIIIAAARSHKRSCTAFLKLAALAYLQRRYLAPDILLLGDIRQKLAMNYNQLKALIDQQRISGRAIEAAMQDLEMLERSILHQLENPISLEDAVRQAAHDPSFIAFLQSLTKAEVSDY